MEIFSSYSGPEFLVFYGVMLATCIVAGLWIPANLREEGRPGEVQNMEEVAVLAGGTERLNLAVLSSLFAKGALDPGGRHTLQVARSDLAESDAERAAIYKSGELRLGEAKKSLRVEAERIEARLIRRGLLMERDERLKLRLLSVLPYAALFAIGLYRQQAGAAAGEPTGFLAGLLCLTFALGLWRFASGNPRTMAGNAVVRSLEEEGSRLRRAPQANEAGYAVAIFGTGVLVGTPWEPVHAARQTGAGGDGGASSGDGDGGGGCGGGCGGCGG